MFFRILYWFLFVVSAVALLAPLLVPAVPDHWIWYSAGAVTALYPTWVSIRYFRQMYLPFILGEAHYREGDGKCVNKKWVWYQESIFWIFMTPVSLLLWGGERALGYFEIPGLNGWVFLFFWVFFFFVRQVVERNISEKDLWNLGKTVVLILLLIAFSAIKWTYNPLAALQRLAVMVEDLAKPEFYLFAAAAFLLATMWEIGTAWLLHRTASDGVYLYRLSLFGKEKRDQIYANSVDMTPQDVLEYALSANPFHVTLRNKTVLHQPVVFGTAYGKGSIDLASLFEHETRDEAAMRAKGQNPGSLLRPSDAEQPGEYEAAEPKETLASDEKHVPAEEETPDQPEAKPS